MTLLKTTGTLLMAVFLTMFVAVQPATAQEDEKNMLMVTLIELEPAKEDMWNTGWEDIVKMADKHKYPHTEMVVSYQNKRWILTPISNYADIDAVEASRGKVAEAAGSRFDRAIEKMQKAEMTSNQSVHSYDRELSYRHPDAGDGGYGKIETYTFRAGGKDAVKAVAKKYKKMATEAGVPGAYDVYWGMLGNQGNVLTVVSTADNALALAQDEAAGQKLMADKKDEMEKLTNDFKKVLFGSTTEFSNFKPEWSMNLPEE